MKKVSYLSILMLVLFGVHAAAQHQTKTSQIDLQDFWDSSHHWYDIDDNDKIITPVPNQPRYKPTQIVNIADNVLLYQKTNGGWLKNYDMLAILTNEQQSTLIKTKDGTNTTFDNGTTFSQVEYLARVHSILKDERYKDASLRGIDFILRAQYSGGGWPQFFPDTSGYRKHITFNDGAMVGVMKVLHRIVQGTQQYSFVDSVRREKVREAFDKGLDCILKCQIRENNKLTVWCQQHDHANFRPQSARTYELASICNDESAGIVLFLMSIDHPTQEIISAVQGSVEWFNKSKIPGVRVKTISAPTTKFIYRTSREDRIVVNDPKAPPIWARFYELGTHKPLFCNRDGKPVYSLSEVERERRTGYRWYTYEPQKVLDAYYAWRKKLLSTK